MIPRRLWLLLFAGLVILGLVVFRERQLAHWRKTAPTRNAVPRILAPRFQVADHHRHVVKFERFLGRQRVVLVFFDSQLGADKDPRVQPLVSCFEAIKHAGIEVVAVSSASRFENLEAEKRLGRDFPFPLLTDIEIDPRSPMDHPAHRRWGRYDVKTDQTRTGLFLIARDGTVPIGPEGFPLPVEDEQGAIEKLCRGEWPQ